MKVTSRRERILQEAARLFRERGYHGANLRELARRAGIQGGSIYHYFSSKQEILFQLMLDTMEEMLARQQDALGQQEGPLGQLRSLVHFHIDFMISGSDRTYITDEELRYLEPANYARIIALRDCYQQQVEKILTQGCEQLGWRVEDVKLQTRMLIGVCSSVPSWYSCDGSLSIEQISSQYTDFFLRGLKRPLSQHKNEGES